MAEYEGRTKVVFVGNLPYDATEQEVQKVFEVAGPVVSFRHVFDRDSNKAKGFGFCEYYDVETASSAVRNLNGVAEVRGRPLRVDFAQPDIKDMPKDQRGARDKNGLPPLPPGVILPPTVNPAESIHKTLQSVQPGQLLDVMHSMRDLVTKQPEQARALLSLNPQLCYALFQSMLLMNLVDPSVLQRIVVPGSAGSANVPPPLQQQAGPVQGGFLAGAGPGQFGGPPGFGGPPPPQQQQQQNNQFGGPPQQPGFAPNAGPSGPGAFPMPPAGGPSQQQSGYGRAPGPLPPAFPPQQPPYGGPAHLQQGYGQQAPGPAGYGTPPPHLQQRGAPMPPQQQQQQQQQAPPAAADAQQTALLQQVLSMTQMQIDMLPPDQRATVMAIRQSAGR